VNSKSSSPQPPAHGLRPTAYGLQPPTCFDLILFSHVAYSGRRGRAHHFVEHLVKSHRVLWIDPPSSFLRNPSLRLARRTVSEALDVISLPGGIPGRNFAPVSELSQRYWARRLRPLLRSWRDLTVPSVFLVQIPALWQTARLLGADLRIYDSHDDWRLMPGNRPALIEAIERHAAREADLVITASEELAARFRSFGALPHDLPDACEFGDWAAADRVPPAPELRDLPRPRFLYFGGIDECFDADALRALTEAFPSGSAILVGQVADPHLARLLQPMHGCLLLGERPYGQLPAFVAGADALILPFAITPRSRARDCVKLYEYLATGLPVISTELPQLRRFPALIEVAPKAEGPAGFARACQRALAADTPERRAARKTAALEHTWARRVEALESLVNAAV